MCRFFLLVSLLFLLPAAAARGETPVRGFSGFRSLFHVAPPVAPVPPVPGAVRPSASPAAMAGNAWPGSLCRSAVLAAEHAHAIPAGLLLAIGLVESGRTDPQTGQRSPWPWAVNVEGRGALFDTREAALLLGRCKEVAAADHVCAQHLREGISKLPEKVLEMSDTVMFTFTQIAFFSSAAGTLLVGLSLSLILNMLFPAARGRHRLLDDEIAARLLDPRTRPTFVSVHPRSFRSKRLELPCQTEKFSPGHSS